MMLDVGDRLVCINGLSGLIYGEVYIVRSVRVTGLGKDICIDIIGGWWFGQIGSSECWTNWFVLEKVWLRNEKLKELGI